MADVLALSSRGQQLAAGRLIDREVTVCVSVVRIFEECGRDDWISNQRPLRPRLAGKSLKVLISE